MSSVVVLWIWLCAYLNCAGWGLSACHALNPTGYAVALLGGAGALWLWSRKTGIPLWPKFPRKKYQRRFRRSFPLGFLVLATLVLLGGALYPPTNYDALAYRLPRVLHWLAAGQWHWIHTIFDRLNNRSCGIEWVSAPVMALLKTDRPLFLINLVSFLFLPGLVFSVFTRLGVRPRVAWHWMWLVPTGYCFLLQAGSVGNDLFGAVFVLAAVDFALRASASGSFTALFTSILAAALMTSAKTNNLPLLLPWAVALLPALKLIFRRPLAALLVGLLAVGSSGLPTIYFNLTRSGDWSGAGLARGEIKHAVIYRTGANLISLSLQNVVPPVFPMAEQWNQAVKNQLPPALARKLASLIEEPGCWFPVGQMQTEEYAGLGLGLTGLLGVSWLAVVWRRRKIFKPVKFSGPAAVRWASALALFALLTQSNISAIGRLFAAYYLLPFTLVLPVAGHETLVRRRWWRRSAGLVFLLAAGLLVISPARPLFPCQQLINAIHPLEAAHPKLVRVEEVYSVYRERSTAFAPALAELPADARVLGYIAYDRPETSLWQPFGSRRIIHVFPSDRIADLKARGINFILVNPDGFESYFHGSLPQWVQQMNATVAKKIPLRLLAAQPSADWWLVQLP